MRHLCPVIYPEFKIVERLSIYRPAGRSGDGGDGHKGAEENAWHTGWQSMNACSGVGEIPNRR
jgi:hypothetical protein